MSASDKDQKNVDAGRRLILQAAGGIVLASVLPVSLVRAASRGDTLKIGYISPQTGPLAVFAEPDAFTLAQVKRQLAGGIKMGGKHYAVEIIYKDSQSNSNRAAEAASELILKDKVDIIVGQEQRGEGQGREPAE
jgi:branched-chain amino acid transport system substrate-binding protein